MCKEIIIAIVFKMSLFGH